MKSDRKAASHPDAKLIRLCVAFASEIAGANAIFEVDPTGDSLFAGPSQHARIGRSREILASISKIEPKTLDGLAAIAGVMEFMLTAVVGGTLQHEEERFARSTARHLHKFFRSKHAAGDHELAKLAAPNVVTDREKASAAR